jgi:pimeloyl-ACP methyl ester carboxylesterase
LHEYALKELEEVISNLIPGKRFFLVGHSDGGSIGLIYAAKRPPLLQGLISEAAHVFVEPKILQGIQPALDSWAQGKLDGLFKYHENKTEVIFKAWAETWQSDWFNSWNIEYLLPSIQCPVLVLQGIDDQYATTRQVDAIASQVGGLSQKAMIDNCAHTPHKEATDTVLPLMKKFIEENIH